MSMRIALAAFAVAAFAATAAATPKWNGAGWYVVADTIGGQFLEKGPYASWEECHVDAPENNDEEDYTCKYLSERPTWDE